MNENIFRFDIPMNDIFQMHGPNSLANLFDDLSHLLFSCLLLSNNRSKGSITHVFQNQVDRVLLFKNAIHRKKPFMVQIVLNFDFSENMLLNSQLFDPLFEQFFDHANKFRFLLSHQKDISMSTLTNLLYNLKITHFPLLSS